MASIHREVIVEVEVETAWAALRNVGDAHALFAPVLVESRLQGDMRIVGFANGIVVQERIVDVNDERRRVAYSALDAPGVAHHHASMQVAASAPGRCVFTWTTDVLPHEAGAALAPVIDQGISAMKRNLETR